jgi:TRAP-type mannitol/chloroaromatic compound transport system permease small subunit
MKSSTLEWVDRLNARVGRVTSYLILAIIAITIWEVFWRYGFNRPTIWVHETSEHLFAVFFLLGGAYTLSQGGHVRVDVLLLRLSARGRALLDIFSSLFFFLFTGLLLWQGIEMAWESVAMLERSQSPWGPYIFHVILMVPVAAFLLLLQGVAFLIRNLEQLRKGAAK